MFNENIMSRIGYLLIILHLTQERVYRTRAYFTPYYFRKRELCDGTYRDQKLFSRIGGTLREHLKKTSAFKYICFTN